MLLSAALPPFYHLWAVFAAFSGAVYLCNRAETFKRLAAIGYCFGFGYFACGFYWIGNALLIDVARTGWLYPLVLFLNGAFFGLFTIIPFMTMKFGKNIYAKIIFLAATWCLCSEWLRGFLLTGFPWNPISSVLSFSPAMLQTLSWWGTYGLSLIVVMAAALPAVWLVRPTRKTFASVLFSVVIFVVLWGYGAFVLKYPRISSLGETVTVRLVQPSIPQSMKWNENTAEDNFQQYISLSMAEDNHAVDFVVWGETASPFDLMYDRSHNEAARMAVPENGYLISGFIRREFGSGYYVPYNSMVVMAKDGEIAGIYDKSHLVPFGEYIPLREYLPDWVQPVANTVAEFGRGEARQTVYVDGYPEFAPLICYEVIFSDEVVRKGNKPKWMVVLTNDGWYGISAGPYQHLVAAQMRAVEEGIAVVRSANSGISAVITPYGEITAQIGLAQKGFVDAVVRLDLAYKTLFGRFGNIIPVTMSLLMLLLSVIINMTARRFNKVG